MNGKIRFCCKFVFLSVLTAALLTSCGVQSNLSSPNDSANQDSQTNKENLTFRITWKTYSGRGEAISRIVESYNAKNQTGYQVSIVDGDEDLSAIEALLEKENSVDIYMLPYRYVQYLGYRNSLEDITENVKNEEKLYYENLWQLGMVKEKVYGVPWLGHSMGLIYNKQLLEQAGVDAADIKNLESLVAACKKVEENTDAEGIGLVGANHNDVSWMVNQFIYGFGGSLVSADGTKVAVNSPNAKAAIEFYKNELGKYAQDTWTSDTGVEVMDYFRNQQIAFEIQGLWGVTDIWQNGKNFDTGVIPLEALGLYPEIGPMMLSLQPQLSEEKKAAAIDFIEYLVSQKAQEMIMEGEYSPEHDAYYPFRLPVRRDISKSLVFEKYPEFSVFLSGFSQPSIDVPVPLWQNIKDKYYAPGLHSVMEGTLSVDEFLLEIETEGNKILQEDAPENQ
ncbi:MAG: extracellular solute-binding protein [Clostridia bacterium]|nr:extracellular solute-binding protein [Clostridia bacterium]